MTLTMKSSSVSFRGGLPRLRTARIDLPPLKLSELHADLKIQERDEFKWKKLKAEGLDEDGEKEAKLARGLSGTSLLSPGAAVAQARAPASYSDFV